MTLHPPKYITSIAGLGTNTTKTMGRISDTVSIGTEIWNEMSVPWREGGTIIAQPGFKWVTKWEIDNPYILTKFLDAKANLVGVYCDISRPVKVIKNGFSFVDLYLDIWQPAGEMPIILDENELEEAVELGHITPEEAQVAREIAAKIMTDLISNADILDF